MKLTFPRAQSADPQVKKPSDLRCPQSAIADSPDSDRHNIRNMLQYTFEVHR